MTPEAVQKEIAGGTLRQVYLLVGDDDRVITAVEEALSRTIEEDLRVFNYERLYASDKGTLPSAAVEAARVVPMMAPRRMVVVLRAEAWLKPRGAARSSATEDDETGADEEANDKSLLAPLTEYLKSPVDSTILVLIASDINRTLAAVKALIKTATVVECWGLGETARGADPLRQALSEIREIAAAAGRGLEPAAARMLAERSGGDIGKLRADLDHLVLFAEGKRAITVADVDAVVSDHETIQDRWALVNAIERGNAAEALKLLAISIENGEAPLKVLGQLAWWVRDKLPRVRPNQAPAAVQAVFRTDSDLKSSGGDPRVLLERLVMELCGAPRRRRA